jgi:chromosomal replication initiator protein
MHTHFEYSHPAGGDARERAFARAIAGTGADVDTQAANHMAANQALSSFSSRMREALGSRFWAAWGKELKVGEADDKSVHVYAPSKLHCQRIWDQVGARKLRAIWADSDSLGRTLELEPDPQVDDRAIRRPATQTPRTAPPKTAPADPGRVPSGEAAPSPRTFANLVEGSCNKYASAAARAISDEKEPPFRLLVLTGAYGSGKSHVAGAIGDAVAARGGSDSLLSCNADGFRAEFVKSLSENKGVDFKERLSKVRVLVVDDLHLLDSSKKTQAELANVTEAVLAAGGRAVFATVRPPEEIEGLEPRLAARLSGAVNCRLEQPDLDHRRRILQEMASRNPIMRRGVEIPEIVLDYVASAIVAMPRDLEAALHTVLSRTAMVGLPVNLETSREALSEMLSGAAKRITVEEIQKAVANYHGMPVTVLLSKRRTRDIVRPRQQAMFLCKEFTTRSLPDIGKRFGDMDHTTVMHACKRIAKLMDESAVVRSDVEQLRRLLRQRRERPTIQ